MLNTKIVCTIGPATDSPEAIRALMRAGMDVVRLNMSHGTHQYHAETLSRIRAVATELNRPIGMLVDLQGPKLRVGNLPAEGVTLEQGEALELCTADDLNRAGVVPVQFKALPRAVKPGDRVLLDDGTLELEVEDIDDDSVMCRVVVGGVLTSNKGMNLPRASLAIAAVTPKDEQDLDFALAHGADWIALSFVRRAEEIIALKEMIRRRAADERLTPVIAKIEKPEAVDVIDEIIAVADGIMVARGDLGIEVSPEAVPMMQKMIIAKCNKAGVPVITATQMLELDDAQPAADARRGQRRGQRDPGRHRRDHAVGRDCGRQVPGAQRGNHGAHRARDRDPLDARAAAAGRVAEAHQQPGRLSRGRGHGGHGARQSHPRADDLGQHGPNALLVPPALPDYRDHT